MATYNSINSNVQGNNTFLGSGAGNITLSGDFNVGIGSDTLNSLTTGLENVGVGYNSLTAVTSGANNVTLGNITGTAITTGTQNTIVGSGSGAFLQTGSNNILLGYLNGSNLTTNESDNIIIANSYAGTNLDTGKIVIGVSGIQTTCAIAGIEGVTPATAGAKVMVIDTNDQLGSLGAMTDGQIIIGSTGANPVVASLTAGANITITPGAGSISIAASGGSSVTYNLDYGPTAITAQPGNVYTIWFGGAGTTVVTLDGTNAIATWTRGTSIQIITDTADWQIVAPAFVGGAVTFHYLDATGTSITSTGADNACITLVCARDRSDTGGIGWDFVVTSTTTAVVVA